MTNVHVEDPVAGAQINWNSQTREARVLRLPPQDQRHGCWRSDSGNMQVSYGGGSAVNPGTRANGAVAGSSDNIARFHHPAHQSPNVEDLGTTTIKGIEAHGHRLTTIIPAGQIGNDKAIVGVNGGWKAPGLGFALRSMSDE